MKNIVFLFFFFFATGFWSQSNDSVYQSRVDFGFSFSPDYSYRILKTGATDTWMKNYYDTLEVPRFSYTIGLNVVFNLNERFFLSTGLLFADRGEKTKKYIIPPVNNYLNHYYYLCVPVKANYYVLLKKVKLFVTAGFAADIYLNGQSNVDVGSSGEQKIVGLSSNLTRLTFSFIGGAGLDCPLTDRWYFKLEPLYRRSLTPIANSDIKKYFYSAGLNLGFYFKF